MDTPDLPQNSKTSAIRSEFDRILMHHVSSLIDTREDIAALPFNLATIASLLLLAERENEIKSFPESPPDRYNRDTFFADIKEIGLELDEDLTHAIQNLERYGFVVINSQGQHIARESTTLLILVLDSIFPQMPGMNLVAYVSQAIEEVITGRKEYNRALRQFDQTLYKQGVRLSAVPEDKLSSSAAGRMIILEPPDPEKLQERRAAYLQKLKAIRAKSLTSEAPPTILTGGTQLKHAKITELFLKNTELPQTSETPPEEPIPSHDTIDDTDADVPDLVEEPLVGETNVDVPYLSEQPLPEIESDSRDATPEELEISPDMAAPLPIPEPDEPSLPEPEPVEIETDLEENLPLPPESETDPGQFPSKEELINQKIRQFEEELAMPCPICGAGKVLSDTTEKGKIYYFCSNEDCHLISWGKPYHMECPICKNPFLIEVPEADGKIGLKCARATCLYRKKGITPGMPTEEPAPGKRRVAVVKKKVKKGVRRVVRRKS